MSWKKILTVFFIAFLLVSLYIFGHRFWEPVQDAAVKHDDIRVPELRDLRPTTPKSLAVIPKNYEPSREWLPPPKVLGKRTIAEVITDINTRRKSEIENFFIVKGVAYPPKKVLFLGVKDQAKMEMWAEGRRIKDYAFTALSGTLGPKLKEGDEQIPEGIYRITAFNPNSAFYLSLRVDYPNTFDKKQASIEGRTDLGGDIFIHGKAVSIGCIAIGDKSIEEVFKISYDTGLKNLKLIIAPVDFREKELSKLDGMPKWVDGLYSQITKEMTDLRELQAVAPSFQRRRELYINYPKNRPEG